MASELRMGVRVWRRESHAMDHWMPMNKGVIVMRHLQMLSPTCKMSFRSLEHRNSRHTVPAPEGQKKFEGQGRRSTRSPATSSRNLDETGGGRGRRISVPPSAEQEEAGEKSRTQHPHPKKS